MLLKQSLSLNPCCSGRCSSTYYYDATVIVKDVLILVVVEDVLVLYGVRGQSLTTLTS